MSRVHNDGNYNPNCQGKARIGKPIVLCVHRVYGQGGVCQTLLCSSNGNSGGSGCRKVFDGKEKSSLKLA